MGGVLGLVSFRVFPTHMGGQKGVALFYQYLQEWLPVQLASSMDNKEAPGMVQERILFPNKKIYRNAFRLKELEALVRKNGSSVLIAEHSYTGWLAWLLHKRMGIPFIIHSHNIESRRFRQMHHWWWRLYAKYEGWIHRKAQHNFFISEEDMAFARDEFHLMERSCSVVTYGVEGKKPVRNRLELKKELGFDPKKFILLFNGTLDYRPNFQAVEVLIDQVEPLLRRQWANAYQIVITGNRAPADLAKKMLANDCVQYAGYVEDVDLYYQAADLFINPVSNDSGVKTKLIEALANHCTAISTTSGAAGIQRELCGQKLVTVADGDWQNFAGQIISLAGKEKEATPPGFFDYYSWKNITRKAAEKITELIHEPAT